MKKTIMVLEKGANIELGKYFNSSEFDCKCSYSSCTKTLIDLEHLVKLINLREELGPIKITSAFRCKKHNKDVGGSPTSQHCKGTATDIVTKSHTPTEIADEAEYHNFDGIGRYKTFTHLDSRGSKARWGSNE